MGSGIRGMLAGYPDPEEVSLASACPCQSSPDTWTRGQGLATLGAE